VEALVFLFRTCSNNWSSRDLGGGAGFGGSGFGIVLGGSGFGVTLGGSGFGVTFGGSGFGTDFGGSGFGGSGLGGLGRLVGMGCGGEGVGGEGFAMEILGETTFCSPDFGSSGLVPLLELTTTPSLPEERLEG
jgi:hypothetical protein